MLHRNEMTCTGTVSRGRVPVQSPWDRLHAYFPESQWPALARELEKGQREERFHRPESLRFTLGARKERWRL